MVYRIYREMCVVWSFTVGGDGKRGTVKEISSWGADSDRSAARVLWDNGQNNIYRLGHAGKVDVVAVKETNGPFYYRDHLPRLGMSIDMFVFEYANVILELFGLLFSELAHNLKATLVERNARKFWPRECI